MAKITKFKDGDKNIRIITQQYEVELYVAVYNDKSGTFLDQFCVDVPEEEYHKVLRDKFKDTLLTD